MIKLIINPKTNPIAHPFSQDIVTIGKKGDLALEWDVSDIHLKIAKQEGKYWAINAAHDPFTTINGLPFGKKALSNQDIISIKDLPILFEIEETFSNKDELQSLFEKLQDLENIPEERERGEEDEQVPILPIEVKRKWNWRIINTLLGSLFIGASFIFLFIYFSVSDSNSENELKAAASVADIAMSLVYAQMHHVIPSNHNWSDPEFIKQNLLSVLEAPYVPAESFESHGQFAENNYLIRIYTSNDLSHFLVIAQPTPTLLRWLIPKASIVLDSKSMELRKTNDLKAINRVLLNTNSLDGHIADEVSQLIKQGKLIPLSQLGNKVQRQGYLPPKALSLIRPGAQDLVYNAPRYFHFGELYLKKALNIVENASDTREVKLLQEEMEGLSKFDNLIFYASTGMHFAANAQKALHTLFPQKKPLVAYLKFNNKGLILSSHLLMEEGPAESGHHLATKLDEKEKKESEPLHPLVLQLRALNQDKLALNKTYLDKINELLTTTDSQNAYLLLERVETILSKGLKLSSEDPSKKAQAQDALQFFSKLKEIFQNYKQALTQEESFLEEKMAKLFKEYSHMPLQKFLAHAKEAGLEDFAQTHLWKQNEAVLSEELLPELQLDTFIANISSSQNLKHLKEKVDEISFLTHLKYADKEKLIACQSKIKKNVLDKLSNFFHSRDTAQEFQEQNRELVAHILKTAWVYDEDEYELYLDMFDLRCLGEKN